jgi:glycosyltransferase involved in cell wall biosynthesis
LEATGINQQQESSSVPPSDGSRRLISIVIPFWNEEESVEALLTRLFELKQHYSFPIELVVVNDGSTDQTLSTLKGLLGRFPYWTLLSLSRNFGQQAAYRAGLDYSRGDAVIFLDADLQDPPELIAEMVEHWHQGAKVVVGCRRSRSERGLRRFLLNLFHTLFKALTGGIMPKDSGTFGLMDRVVVDHVRNLPEVNLFLPALRSWFGYKQATIYYDRAPRSGRPKQTLLKLVNYAWDGITSFSDLPLKLIGLLGLVISSLGFCYAFILLSIKLAQVFGFFRELEVMGFTTLAVAVLFIGGIQLLCLGIIGEYIARSYKEAKRRPIYIVEEVQQTNL